MSDEAQTYTCQCCFDDDLTLENTRFLGADALCHDCITDQIQPLFEKAIDFERCWPARWKGNEETVLLRIEDFQDVLDADFVQRYHRKEIEYRTPSLSRIYCKHKVFADQLPPSGGIARAAVKLAISRAAVMPVGTELRECGAMVSGEPSIMPAALVCYHCSGDVCGKCETPLDSPTEVHGCEAPTKSVPQFEGLERGVHFQFCPTCLASGIFMPVELMEACNAMHCERCDSSFCFLCGEVADHDSNHWAVGSNCPRWGPRSDDNAIFDPVLDRTLLELPTEFDADAVAEATFLERRTAQAMAGLLDHYRTNDDLLNDPDEAFWIMHTIEVYRQNRGERMWHLARQETVVNDFVSSEMGRILAANANFDTEVHDFVDRNSQVSESQVGPYKGIKKFLLFPRDIRRQLQLLKSGARFDPPMGAGVNDYGTRFLAHHNDLVQRIRHYFAEPNSFRTQLPSGAGMWDMYLQLLGDHAQHLPKIEG